MKEQPYERKEGECEICLHDHDDKINCMDCNFRNLCTNNLRELKCTSCNNPAYLSGNWCKCRVINQTTGQQENNPSHYYCIVCTYKQGKDHSRCIDIMNNISVVQEIMMKRSCMTINIH
jgi:hypothetical protein